VKLGGMVQLVITSVKVATLVGVILLPWLVVGFTSDPLHPPRIANLQPVLPADWSTISWSKFGAALVGVIWAYHGWMNIAPVAEEVKEPQRNIPRALILGVGLLIVLYVGANIAYHLVIPAAQMADPAMKETAVATVFSRRLLGNIGGILTAAAIGVSVFGALNGNILVGPRLLYAMAEDRLAPAAFGKLHPTWKTPVLATVVMSAWSALLVLIVGAAYRYGVFDTPGEPAKKAPFDITTDYAMFGAIALETFAVLAVIVFRFTRPGAPRPYRCIGYPVVPIAYGIVMLLVWLNMFATKPAESYTGIGFMIAGALVYLLFLRSRATPRSR